MAGSANRNAVAPAQPSPTSARGGNVFQQSSGALTGAIRGSNQAMQYRPQQVGTQFGYDPFNAQAQNAVGGIPTYMNPYTQQVIDTSMADLERQRMMQQNQLGAQASAAGAFGGSRQGVAEALTNEAFARQGGQLAAGLRQQGFNTALGAAQADVNRQMQAELANQAAYNAERQFAQNLGLTAQQANQQAGLQAAQLRMNAAGQLGNLSQTGFGQGMAITDQQMRQGAMQQALQQQLIDSARGQYQATVGAPQQALSLPLQALGAAPVPQTQTTTRQPGLFDYLTAGATLFSGSDRRLKTNIKPEGEAKGIKFYSWDWNEEGKRVRNPDQPGFGVMADELQETHPHLVIRGEDGYLRVNYAGLKRELLEAA